MAYDFGHLLHFKRNLALFSYIAGFSNFKILRVYNLPIFEELWLKHFTSGCI